MPVSLNGQHQPNGFQGYNRGCEHAVGERTNLRLEDLEQKTESKRPQECEPQGKLEVIDYVTEPVADNGEWSRCKKGRDH